MKQQRISLIIPVYNEVERINDCLAAIARQTVKPFEVIVIDNNSTDGSAILAANFPFVRLLDEPKQGVVYARDRGFNAARGDIIARIDADTVIDTDWIATLQTIFSENLQVSAISGMVTYRDIALSKVVNRLDLFWRRRMARLLGRDVALQGANMALRRSSWLQIRNQVCHSSGQHEDFDLALHITKSGGLARFDERLQASVCYRQASYNFDAFCEYALISPRTYLSHGVKSGRKMYQVVAFVIILYPIINLLCKGYDQQLGLFTFRKLLAPSCAARVNPATFVD